MLYDQREGADTMMMRTLLFLSFFPALVHAASPSADEIIKKADDIRNPGESYLMKVSVSSEGTDTSVFEVSINGNDKTFIKTLEPARDSGRNMLMLDEEMWAYIPNLKRAVRISLSQKLTGQAANGDISRMRWSGDYDAKIEKETGKDWTIYLTAKKKGLTYDKIRTRIHKKTFRPIVADFLTPAGKPLKRATYSEYKKRLGKERPHLIRIQDAIRKDDVSEIRILDMQIKTFPASLFNQNSLR